MSNINLTTQGLSPSQMLDFLDQLSYDDHHFTMTAQTAEKDIRVFNQAKKCHSQDPRSTGLFSVLELIEDGRGEYQYRRVYKRNVRWLFKSLSDNSNVGTLYINLHKISRDLAITEFRNWEKNLLNTSPKIVSDVNSHLDNNGFILYDNLVYRKDENGDLTNVLSGIRTTSGFVNTILDNCTVLTIESHNDLIDAANDVVSAICTLEEEIELYTKEDSESVESALVQGKYVISESENCLYFMGDGNEYKLSIFKLNLSNLFAPIEVRTQFISNMPKDLKIVTDQSSLDIIDPIVKAKRLERRNR